MVDVRPDVGEIGDPQGAGFLYDAGVEIIEELTGLGVFDLGDDEVGVSLGDVDHARAFFCVQLGRVLPKLDGCFDFGTILFVKGGEENRELATVLGFAFFLRIR